MIKGAFKKDADAKSGVRWRIKKVVKRMSKTENPKTLSLHDSAKHYIKKQQMIWDKISKLYEMTLKWVSVCAHFPQNMISIREQLNRVRALI